MRPKRAHWIFAAVLAVVLADMYAVWLLFGDALRFIPGYRYLDPTQKVGLAMVLLAMVCTAISVLGILWRIPAFRWVMLLPIAYGLQVVISQTAYYVWDFHYPKGPALEGAYLSWSNFSYAFRWIMLTIVNALVLFGPIGTSYFTTREGPHAATRLNTKFPDETSPSNTVE